MEKFKVEKVKEISKIKGEPKWMDEFRIKSFEKFKDNVQFKQYDYILFFANIQYYSDRCQTNQQTRPTITKEGQSNSGNWN